MSPTISVGLRGDGKENQSIFGMEVGSGLSYTSNFGLTLTGNGNMFLIELGEIEKWSLLGTLRYDQDNDLLGTIMEISPSFGQMQGSNIAAHCGAVIFLKVLVKLVNTWMELKLIPS